MSSLAAAGRGRSPCGEHRAPRHTAPIPQRVVRFPWSGVLEGGTIKKPVGHICTLPAELTFLAVPLSAPCALRPAPCALRPAPCVQRSAGSFIARALRGSIVTYRGHTSERRRVGGKLRGGAPQRGSAPPAGWGGENGGNGENGETGTRGKGGALAPSPRVPYAVNDGSSALRPVVMVMPGRCQGRHPLS